MKELRQVFGEPERPLESMARAIGSSRFAPLAAAIGPQRQPKVIPPGTPPARVLPPVAPPRHPVAGPPPLPGITGRPPRPTVGGPPPVPGITGRSAR